MGAKTTRLKPTAVSVEDANKAVTSHIIDSIYKAKFCEKDISIIPQ